MPAKKMCKVKRRNLAAVAAIVRAGRENGMLRFDENENVWRVSESTHLIAKRDRSSARLEVLERKEDGVMLLRNVHNEQLLLISPFGSVVPEPSQWGPFKFRASAEGLLTTRDGNVKSVLVVLRFVANEEDSSWWA